MNTWGWVILVAGAWSASSLVVGLAVGRVFARASRELVGPAPREESAAQALDGWPTASGIAPVVLKRPVGGRAEADALLRVTSAG